jgi:glucose/arabinose dehydrogenase
MSLRSILAVLPLAGLLAAVPADPPAAPPTAFECRWADAPVNLDGADDEPAWKRAQAIDSFHLFGEKATSGTRAKLLWDRDYLYFFADLDDADLVSDDVLALFVKPAVDKPGYFEFRVTAAGAVSDRFFPKRDLSSLDKSGDADEFPVEAKVKHRGTLDKPGDADRSWSVEGRIPWAAFLRAGGRPEPGEAWTFALCRYDFGSGRKEPALSTSAPIREKKLPAVFHQTEDYARLIFVGPDGTAAKPHGIDKRVPLNTSTVVGSPDPPPPYRVKRVYPDFSPAFPIMAKAIPGTGQLLVITEAGPYGKTTLYRVKDDPAAKTADAVKVMDTPDGGVAYDFAFHPKFVENGFVYVGWNSKAAGREKHFTRVTRYTMGREPPYAFDPRSAQPVIEWESNGHNGGAVCFGTDGMLYVTSGDGTSDSDGNLMGQRTDALLAKVLRIDVDHPAAGKPYAVPTDNPFVGDNRFAPETWAYGLRNPWRIASDPKTGHVWVGNNGQDLWETAYLIEKGANYGWSVLEGSHEFYPNRQAGPTPFAKPTVEHHHSEFRSLTGGFVYHGEKLPDLRGAYVYGDYSTGRIWAMKHDGTKPLWHKELAGTRLQITGFGTDSRGELLVCDHRGNGEGGLYTLEPTPTDLPPSTFPKKLSESGLFDSVKDHRMKPGVVPYSVNAPFWSDGMHKDRWIALPAGGRIDFTRTRGWNFPDKTVIVKSFALPDSRKWVETRFLTKQGSEWYGYSYVWNEAGTDAELVPAGGLDKEFTTEGRKQVWHYPSRAECLVCHSRAQNFVLGLSTLQMNKDHDYGGRTDNQLRVLEHLGMMTVDWAGEARAWLNERAAARGLKGKEANESVSRNAPQPSQRPVNPAAARDLLPRLVDPYDPKQDLAKRARSWLHANCSQCHVEAGGGNAQMELEFTTAADKMRVLGVKPLHHTFDLPDAKLIAPGDPDRSVVLKRVGTRGPGQMPPLSTNRVDEAGLKLLREWVAGLK